MDFDPVIIKDVTNRTIVIQSKNIPRDVWMLARFLGYRPEIISEPKRFEWINRMIQQVAWDIFDNPYGPNSQWIEPESGKVHYPENLTPTSKDVWQVILSFHDYMDNLPSKLMRDGIGIVFPYNNATALKEYMADKTNRTIALLYLADLPSVTFDKSSKQVITGINAMKKFVEQLTSEYEEILNAYNVYKDSHDYGTPLDAWRMWLYDRANHGLPNTVEQFSGIKWPSGEVNPQNIDNFLSEVYPHWKLVKIIYGYESLKASDWGGEWEMYRFGLPIAFKAFGIPYNQGIGASGNFGYNFGLVEFTVYGIPQSVIDELLNQKNLGKIAIGYGNGISLMSCIDGVEKIAVMKYSNGVLDGVKFIFGKNEKGSLK